MPYVSGFDRDQLMCCSWDAFVDKESIARIIDAFVNHLDIGKYGVKPVAAEGRPSYDSKSLYKIYKSNKCLSCPFCFQKLSTQQRKNEVTGMIENKNDASRNLEKALQALKQAQQRVANEKKKQNEKKRKAENHHKYIMGGIIVKYFPDCYRYDEGELNRILSVALQTRECQQIISKIKSESRETTPPQSTLPNAENESEGGTE